MDSPNYFFTIPFLLSTGLFNVNDGCCISPSFLFKGIFVFDLTDGSKTLLYMVVSDLILAKEREIIKGEDRGKIKANEELLVAILMYGANPNVVVHDWSRDNPSRNCWDVARGKKEGKEETIIESTEGKTKLIKINRIPRSG